MILEEETFDEYGYYPSELKPQSHKKILAVCDGCGKVRVIEKAHYRSLCRSCCHKGEKHPMFGITGERNHRWNRVKRICETCGKEFEVKASRAKKGKGQFCSCACANKGRKGENNPEWKGGLVKRICEVCGKEFEVYPSRIKNGLSRFCSRSCPRKKQAIPKHHTKPERIFERICEKYNLPFHYVGDGSLWIGKNPSINPDFVECNGKKIAVEVFGDYWHSPLLRYNIGDYQRADVRTKTLKKYGWKLIVLWQTDLLREDADAFVVSVLKKEKVL